jgi:hypothetical protein
MISTYGFKERKRFQVICDIQTYESMNPKFVSFLPRKVAVGGFLNSGFLIVSCFK